MAALIGLPGTPQQLAADGGAVHLLPAVADQPVRAAVLVPVAGRGGDLLPRRHRHPLRRCVGPGPGQGAGAGEPDLPGEPRGHRGGRWLRPRRHPAVRPARHRQDAAGRGGRGRDRQAVRVRGARRVHEHVLRGGHPQGEGPVPQAAQAGRCATGAWWPSSTRPTLWATGARRWAARAGSAPSSSRPSFGDATEAGSSYPYLSPGAQRALQEAALGGYDRAGLLGAYGGDPWTGPGGSRS